MKNDEKPIMGFAGKNQVKPVTQGGMGDVTKPELQRFVRNIRLVIEGKADKQIIAKDQDLISRIVTLERGVSGKSGFGLEHLNEHIKSGSLTENDVYRLAELFSTASKRIKQGTKVYYNKPENPFIAKLLGIVADNPQEGRTLTAFKARPKQLEDIFSNSGGTPKVPSSDMLSQVPGAGRRNFPGLQTTKQSIAQDVKDMEDFFSGKINDIGNMKPMYSQPQTEGVGAKKNNANK